MLNKETPYIKAINEMFDIIAKEFAVHHKGPIRATLAGGAAAHLYTQSRFSKDVDAYFVPALHVRDVVVHYRNVDGTRKVLGFDTNYTPHIGLIHPDYEKNSRYLKQVSDNLHLLILSPLDLAVSKLGRFMDHDIMDIVALSKHKLINASKLKEMGEEALDYYVGDPRWVKFNIRDAVELVEEHNPDGRIIDVGRP